jgi:hypothetical protein
MRRRSLLLALPLLLIGTITLVAPPERPAPAGFAPDGTVLADCAPGALACYRQAFGNLAFADGAPAAFAALRASFPADRSLLDACHPITHAIGVATLVASGGDAERALAVADPLCQSGFAHAVVEREILGVDDGSPAAAAERLGRYCERADLWPGPLERAECFHGLGHGLLIARDGDLPFVLEACDAMTGSLGYGWLRYCILGAFMELNAPIAPIELRWLRADDPAYPCTELDERYAVTCYGQMAARLLRDLAPERVAERCLAVSLATGRIECLISLLLVVEPADETPARIGRICATASPYENACLTGYVRGRRDREPTAPTFVAGLCAGLATDPAAADRRSLARACARAVGYEYLVLEPAERCRTLSIGELVEACLAAAAAPEDAAGFVGAPTR